MCEQIPVPVGIAILCVAGCGGTDGLHQVSVGGGAAYEASVATMGDRFVVGWHDTRDGSAALYFRVLDVRGRPSSPERRLTSTVGPAYEPDIDVIEDNLLVAWYERTSDGTKEAKLGVFTLDGAPKRVATLSAGEGGARNPIVETDGRRVFCAWLEEDADMQTHVWGRWFDSEGRPRGSARYVAPAGSETWNLNATLDEYGRAWIVFDARIETRAAELFLALVDDNEAEVARLTSDDGYASKYPDLAFGQGQTALVWFDERDGNREVYLLVTSLEEILEGRDRQATRVTSTPGESIGAYVAWNGRYFGLAWSDDTEGRHEVYFQAFDAAGNAVQRPRRITTNATASLIPAIEPAGGQFALAWNEDVVEMRQGHGAGGRSEIVFALLH